MPADDPPKVLLFDVMSTLVTDPFYEIMPAFFGMTFEELLAAKHPTAWVDFEHGRMDAGTFLDQFFADGRDFDRAGFMRAVRGGYDLDGLRARLTDAHGPRYWRSLEELADDEEFRRYLDAEFPEPAALLDAAVSRRGFLKVMAASLALAGLGGCRGRSVG